MSGIGRGHIRHPCRICLEADRPGTGTNKPQQKPAGAGESDGAFELAGWGKRLTGVDEATVHPLIVEIVPKQR